MAAVQKLGLHGTPAEERFDKLTRMARRMFNVPVSIIDIVGEKRVWMKSIQGMDILSAPREESYCSYTILEGGVCMVPDARLDPRLAEHAAINTHVFYAGVPLKFEGQNVGVFCISDDKPRTLDSEELEMLRDLAELAERELNVCRLSEFQMQLAREKEALHDRAHIDGLTRAWNRMSILEIAQREVTNRTTALALLDIDHFKQINDTYGHQAGDEVLAQVARRIRSVLRVDDGVGRYGGEEFLLVFPGCRQDVTDLANVILTVISKTPIVYEGIKIPVTVSIGVSFGAKNLKRLIKAADIALYSAKQGGRNMVRARWITDIPEVKA